VTNLKLKIPLKNDAEHEIYAKTYQASRGALLHGQSVDYCVPRANRLVEKVSQLINRLKDDRKRIYINYRSYPLIVKQKQSPEATWAGIIKNRRMKPT
jgi:hypothetical protein